MARSLLGASELRGRLQQGDIIANWTASDEDSIRGASYDIHIAADDLTIPDGSGGSIHYEIGKPRKRQVILPPGGVASVTSQERLCLPWDVAGNIGVRFGFASQGILVHTGLLVHPGYGHRPENGVWVKDPQRLHFLIANISSHDIAFAPGLERIASIQFLLLEGSSDNKNPGGLSGGRTEELSVSQLGLFTEYSSVRQEIATMKASYSNIILFGVYVLAAAFLGVVLTFLVNLLTNAGKMTAARKGLDTLDLSWPEAVVIAAVLFFALTIVAVFLAGAGHVLRATVDWVRRRLARRGFVPGRTP